MRCLSFFYQPSLFIKLAIDPDGAIRHELSYIPSAGGKNNCSPVCYQVVRHTLGAPDTFRLRYRNALIDCVGEAVRQVGRGNAIDTGEVLLHLAKDLVPENDREHFLKIAEEEIAALHEGNYARYRLRPSEFKDWQKRKI
jgi:hypothetical protein